MSIRLAKIEDLLAMTEIYNQAIERRNCTADMDPFSIDERLPWFRDHQNQEYPLYIYQKDQQVVGYVYLSGYRPGRRAMRQTVEISYYIHNDFQGQGIGTKLLDYAIEKCRELKYKNAVGILLSCNEPSIRLLKKFGFEEWGCLPDIADFDGVLCSHLYYGLKL